MKKNIYNLLATLIGIFGLGFTAKVSRADCSIRENDSIEIPINIQFKNPDFKTKWVYNSLEPSLRVLHKSYDLTPQSSTISNGRLEVIFCIDADDSSKLLPEFTVNLASRSLTIRSRPIKWEKVTTSKSGIDTESNQGKMTTINLLNQPDPDWIIIKKAELLYNSEGTPRIDVLVHNFTKESHSGFELKLYWRIDDDSYDIFCVNYPGVITYEIPIEVEFGKEDISIASGDIQFQELIQRNASLGIGCGGAILKANLGNIGQLPSENILRIRYVFNEIQTENIFLSTTEEEIFNAPGERQILITGDRVYPKTIKVLD